MSFKPQLALKVPAFDFEAFRELGEQKAIARVDTLSIPELCCSQSALIDRLVTWLPLEVPTLRLDEAVESVGEQEGFGWHQLEVPFTDSSGIVSLIKSPDLPTTFDFEIDVVSSIVRISGCYEDETTAAHGTLAYHVLSQYRRNIRLAAEHVDRFNQALPYILSVIIQDRVNQLSEINAEFEEIQEPPSKEEIRQTLEDLIKEGKFFAVEETDHEMGEVHTHYYAARQSQMDF